MTKTSLDTRLKLLIIDDDDLVIQTLKMTIPETWRLISANSLTEVKKDEIYHAAFIDLHLSQDHTKAEGLRAITTISELDPHLEIIAISGDLSRELMESSLKAGASRFLAKPISKNELHLVLKKIEAYHLLREATQRNTFSNIPWIGSSSQSENLRKQIASLKGENSPILIEAESGAGKEVAACLIHEQEGKDRPFVSVNLGAIPENLFESEFFGHVKGAFTGAEQNRMGFAEAANGGDLFLDEVEALPLPQQAKLLRFLETGELRRVGSKDTIHVKVRIIAATNQNLQKMVSEQKFREDLLWRLSGQKLLIPPLRERIEDIPELVQYFFDHAQPRRNKKLENDAISELKKYSFPGNVRELKRLCEQLALVTPLPIIRAEDIKRLLSHNVTTAPLQNIDLSRSLSALMNEYEALVIKKALEQQPDIDLAAKLLGISRSSLYKKIGDYNIGDRKC